MRRGELWWAELPEPAGRRPVVLVSRNEAYLVRTSVTVVEVTTTMRGIRSEVGVGKREGMKQSSVVNADNVQTIRKQHLAERIGTLTGEKLAALDLALAYSLALPHPSG